MVQQEETDELRKLIHSLGLFDDRLQSLCAVTRAFMLPEVDETDAFDIDLKASFGESRRWRSSRLFPSALDLPQTFE